MSVAIPLALALGFAGAYVWLAWRSGGWPLSRTAAFLGGIVVLLAAPLGPSGTLPAHMLEHSLLVAVAAPLVVLGSPVVLVARSLDRPTRTALFAALREPPIGWLTRPAVAWALFVASQWIVHSGEGLSIASGPGLGHALEHGLLFWIAVLFWLPVVGKNPVPVRLRAGDRALYLFFASAAVDLVAVSLVARGDAAAGATMAAGMLPIAIAAAICTWQWLVEEERETARFEARASGEAP
jgi:cytochrome c oxidase assembly factor CtaG